jgi:starvation-inducible DNA-binding protein
MNKLIEQMKVLLGGSFSLYLKVHGFHWNIKGPDFYQYHTFLEKIYSELYGVLDPIAEEIRALDAYAPGSVGRMKELSFIQDEERILEPLEMFRVILADNDKMLAEIKKTYSLAEAADEIGLSNFLQDRYDAHKKLAWMIKSTVQGVR